MHAEPGNQRKVEQSPPEYKAKERAHENRDKMMVLIKKTEKGKRESQKDCVCVRACVSEWVREWVWVFDLNEEYMHA